MKFKIVDSHKKGTKSWNIKFVPYAKSETGLEVTFDASDVKVDGDRCEILCDVRLMEDVLSMAKKRLDIRFPDDPEMLEEERLARKQALSGNEAFWDILKKQKKEEGR